MNNNYQDGRLWPEDAIWEHLDFYVRRFEGQLVLVQTMLKREPAISSDAVEIITFYFELDELDPEWADAVWEQGAELEEGKSCDFAPPNEDLSIFHGP